MIKNPYNKDTKEYLPLHIQGPSTLTVLMKNEERKDFLKEKMSTNIQKYEAEGVSFNTVLPPLINKNMSVNPPNVINVEMGQTEVTQELFEAVMGWNGSDFTDTPQNPIENITWFDCIDFCNKISVSMGLRPCYEIKSVKHFEDDFDSDEDIVVQSIEKASVEWDESADGFRLPTVYEWEAFAKAGTQNQWAGTNYELELDNHAWYEENTQFCFSTYPVGKMKPNQWGLYDMSGNVWEWCWDRQDSDSGWLLASRMVSGGAFYSIAAYCAITHHQAFSPSQVKSSIGFRICRDLK